MAPLLTPRSTLNLAVSALGLRDHDEEPDPCLPTDALSDILSNMWFWLIFVFIAASIFGAGWFAHAYFLLCDVHSLPRYSQSRNLSAQTYISVANPQSQPQSQSPWSHVDASQLQNLQTQLRGRDATISTLKAKVDSLSIGLRSAQAELAQADSLQKEARRQSNDTILSLNAKVDMYRAQACNREKVVTPLETKVVSLSQRAEANLNADAKGLSASRVAKESDTVGPSLSAISESLDDGSCGRCTPPVHVLSLKDRGFWLREKGDALVAEAGDVLFEAHNPALVGPKAKPWFSGMRVDLHLQYREATRKFTEQYATSARDRGFKKIIFIVGRGLHAEDKISKLHPVAMEILNKLGFEASSPPKNPGEIVVNLQKKAGD